MIERASHLDGADVVVGATIDFLRAEEPTRDLNEGGMELEAPLEVTDEDAESVDFANFLDEAEQTPPPRATIPCAQVASAAKDARRTIHEEPAESSTWPAPAAVGMVAGMQNMLNFENSSYCLVEVPIDSIERPAGTAQDFAYGGDTEPSTPNDNDMLAEPGGQAD